MAIGGATLYEAALLQRWGGPEWFIVAGLAPRGGLKNAAKHRSHFDWRSRPSIFIFLFFLEIIIKKVRERFAAVIFFIFFSLIIYLRFTRHPPQCDFSTSCLEMCFSFLFLLTSNRNKNKSPRRQTFCGQKVVQKDCVN